jgi:hypothetical protein
MLKGCLIFSSMRIGVPFIAPRQLGAVESNPGRQFCLLSTGAPGSPVHHRTLSGADFFPVLVQPTVGDRFGAVGAPDTVRCTPDSPMHTGQSGAPFRPLGRPRVTRGLHGRPLAQPTVDSPDSPVIYSRTPPTKPESSQFARASLAHRTLSGAPPDSQVLPD